MGEFIYSAWRHGGWYVDNVRYPSGAVGCVSRNYPDRKWRIVCDEREGDYTYPNRDAAARAELRIACTHPPDRIHSWKASDGTMCVACNDCGTVLSGGC